MRICAVSDLHGHLPVIPPCDVLVVGGDICPDTFGKKFSMHYPELQLRWFQEIWVPWASKQAPLVLGTWGNHDWCGHLQDGGYWNPADNVHMMIDQGFEQEGIKFWFSPWSNRFMNWAFMKPPAKLKAIYEGIPEGIDVLVSHQPPYGFGDLCPDWERDRPDRLIHVASKELLHELDRVSPQVVFCGHLHSGRGIYNHNDTVIMNVTAVNERYELVYDPVVIPLHPREAETVQAPV